jgi:hypothetical protein
MDKKYFECPHCKIAPKNGQWHRTYKWKTERGFNNHECWKDIKIKQDIRNSEIAEEKRIALEKAIAESKYKIGDKVNYVSYTVTKPTHTQMGNRLIHVRYEEERSYWNSFDTIEKIEIGGYIICGRFIKKSDIFDKKEEAYNFSKKSAESYKEHCDFSSFCR